MINVQKIEIDKIVITDLYDIKEQNNEYYQKLKNQINKNGELLPILVRKVNDSYEVIDGLTRVKIYNELGWEVCHANVIENISDKKAQLIKLQLFEGFEFDVLKISKVIKSIAEKIPTNIIEKSINFNQKQIDRFIDIYNWDWSIFQYDAIPEEIKQAQNIKNTKIKTLF